MLFQAAEDGGEIDLARAEHDGPAPAGNRPGDRVGGMHRDDVRTQLMNRFHRIVAVHDEQPGCECAGEGAFGERVKEPQQVFRIGPACLHRDRGAHAVAPGAEVGQHLHQQLPLGIVFGDRNVADMDRQQLRSEVVGQLHRGLRGGHTGLERLGIAIAPPRRKVHRRHPQAVVVEPLADLPQARAADLIRRETIPAVHLDSIHTKRMGDLQTVTKVPREPDGGNSQTVGEHVVKRPASEWVGFGLGVYDFDMPILNDVTAALRQIAPLQLAADWDAVGLLVGSRREACERVMTCLTLTADVAEEAAREQADLVVTHHPLPFRPIARITDDTPYGRVLLSLLSAGVAVWSSHTAWDSAAGGINDQLATLLGLSGVRPILPHPELPTAGTGRMGNARGETSVGQLATRLATSLAAPGCQVAGDGQRPAGTVGIVCGSGGEMLGDLIAAGCTTLVTGEVRLHTAAEAIASGLAVIAVGHHASEHFSMAELGRRLSEQVTGLTTWASRAETDPLRWIPAKP